MTTELRTYNDPINDTIINFNSDASQKLITSLEFNGEWYVVREILRDWGYVVIEHPSNN